MVELLPLELGQFRVFDPGDMWTHVIMVQNHALRSQPIEDSSSGGAAGGGEASAAASGGGTSFGGSPTFIRREGMYGEDGGGYGRGGSGLYMGGSGNSYSGSGGTITGEGSFGGSDGTDVYSEGNAGGMFGLGLRARPGDDNDDSADYNRNNNNSTPEEDVLYIPLEQYGKFRKSGRYERALPDVTNEQLLNSLSSHDVPWILRALHLDQYAQRKGIHHDNKTGRTENSSKHRNRNYILPLSIEQNYKTRDKNNN
ncbi:heterogeneous nuclear ribonucleoprotein A1-like [Argiope bruennichi]|uniref:heterogeneous nuclear ribonucleoprotein A1-like n=1 Tax=Argiope bruennichi TaxID=94029 RepID=UPI002493E0D2|nr:heterogeneous nuclear ribonucleoprotein A1-like [Argiope bruennichi]